MNAITISGVTFLLIIPVMAAAVLAVLPGYRLSASLNMAAAFLTLLAALSLFIWKPATGPYILVDDLNIVFVVLNSFVGFTTSVFSASYIAHELETGRLTPAHLRFYHSMYQVLLFAMNFCFGRQQHRPDVGCDRDGDAHHGDHGWHLSHGSSDRGRLEIFHPGQRRHCACAVWHDPRLYGCASGRRRG